MAEVLSPDPQHRWRVAYGVVERSSDGGVTWSALPGVARGQVLAIAAPALDVAWLVGRAGTVLVSTAAGGLLRVTFPEPVDLTSVRARSRREADVTTADGRTFGTTDGGETWSLQEIQGRPF